MDLAGRMVWDKIEDMTIITPRSLEISSCTFNVFIAIDYIFLYV